MARRSLSGALFNLRKSEVGGIRFCSADKLSPPSIPLPYELWIAGESLGGSEVFRAILAPKAFFAPERRDAALAGNSRAGQNADRGYGGK
jgi:hypothetical protein